MRIAQVIGKVTLLRAHPLLKGASYKIVVPLTREGLQGGEAGRTEPLVMFDSLGAGNGCYVALSESAEAANPFHPETKPVDAYNAAILDTINVEGRDASA
jgi:microcompartment protein CcmK/EutM